MINKLSLEEIKKQAFLGNFIKPSYGSYCFSGIPGTVEQLLTGATNLDCLPTAVLGNSNVQYEQVVLLFVDAFGWRFFERYLNDFSELRELEATSVVSQLTSQFPSTTTNHVSQIYTGLQPCQTGLYEWFQYEHTVDTIVSPLLFAEARNNQSLINKVSAEEFYPELSFYKSLRSKGVETAVFVPEHISQSIFNRMINNVSRSIPFNRTDNCFDLMLEFSNQVKGPAYLYFYLPDFDGMMHHYGPFSQQANAVAESFFKLLVDKLISGLKNNGKKTALILCADHGMVEVSPKKTFYLNREFPELEKFLKRSAGGELQAPCGSSRDFFLRVIPEHQQLVKELLESGLSGIAKVLEVPDLIKQNFFGNKEVSERFLKNIGDLVILPEAGEAVWWYEQDIFEQRFFGMHGGLTPQEMLIPFIFTEI